MKRTLLLPLALLITLPLVALDAGTAEASIKRSVSYDFTRVWPAAVRFLRIDEGHKIIEKDASTGYVLFEVAQDNRLFRGALEIIRTTDDDGRKTVQLVLRISERPSYVVALKMDKLLAKLRSELGSPLPPPAKPVEPAPPSKTKGKQKAR